MITGSRRHFDFMKVLYVSDVVFSDVNDIPWGQQSAKCIEVGDPTCEITDAQAKWRIDTINCGGALKILARMDGINVLMKYIGR